MLVLSVIFGVIATTLLSNVIREQHNIRPVNFVPIEPCKLHDFILNPDQDIPRFILRLQP